MILLKDEHELNTTTLARWNKALRHIAERAWGTQKERGEKLDVTPIHHRLQPAGMLHEIRKRGLRVESLMSASEWYTDPQLLRRIRDECIDVANYATFLGAFTLLLSEELVEEAIKEAQQ